ncbi:LPS export ABC transporter permease LptG [Aquirhabdus parva]|uniref:LPS export ABC transporter permease LptG n=1 Tax=Aquirhabdus parva TaxID=2283318 RepID=A0A345P2T5_9GAMM|nr:LPS export ABC transporter permease LptG [Aquirhabdus parva]AXI01594.1 LPS export ABC transporter permease LptG [Aquirhabdus parva]
MIMRRHVIRVTFSAMIGVVLILLIVQMLFVFLGQMSDLKDTYRIGSALRYVLLQTPGNFYSVLPIGALIGAVVGLGSLASSSELIVMRASGVSVWRIVGWVLRPALILGLVAFAASQWIIPPATQKAELIRSGVAKDSGVHGYWHKEGQEYAFISYANEKGALGVVKAFHFNDDQRLLDSWQAPSGQFQGNQIWILNDVSNAKIQPTGQSFPIHAASQIWSVNLKPKLLSAATADPDELSPSQLFKYGRLLSSDKTPVPSEYKLSFWQKILAPLGLMSLVVLACAFVFGSLRNRSMGFRIVIALLVGLGFRYLQDFIGYVGLVAGGWTILYVLMPILAVFALGGYFLKRAR